MSGTVGYYSSGETEYGFPKIHESYNSHYQCENCGWKLPVELNAVDDNALEEWPAEQPYNRKHV